MQRCWGPGLPLLGLERGQWWLEVPCDTMSSCPWQPCFLQKWVEGKLSGHLSGQWSEPCGEAVGDKTQQGSQL